MAKLKETHAREVLAALDDLKAVDPACGSGAYLLGLLQEMIVLYRLLYSEKLVKDARTLYDLKLRIISHSLYGVDIDPFATNIAKLRLWLSLAVEADKPVPLPNLDFKVETGDSLLAPDPQEMPDLFRGLLQASADVLAMVKNQFFLSHGEEKEEYRKTIVSQESRLRKKLTVEYGEGVVDWRIQFAEAFANKRGGFDIVLANPPYVRQELLGREYKESGLKPVYLEVYAGTADLYVYFYARAQQLLRTHGIGCFISSNKWIRTAYGEKLRQLLLDKQAFRLAVDFGELPVFAAASTFPGIFVWQKQPRLDAPTLFAVVKNLEACYEEGIANHVLRVGTELPAANFGLGKPRLTSRAAADRRLTMESHGQRLVELVNDDVLNGVKSGLNEAFIIDTQTRNRLLEEDGSCSEIIKPFLIGDDIRRYETHSRERFVLYVRWDCDIRCYPSVLRWLKTFRPRLELRDGVKGNGPCPWYALSRPRPETQDRYGMPKIVYPDIGKETRFAMDKSGYYLSNTAYFIAREDWYLLGVLNSQCAFEYLKTTCAALGDQEKGGRLRFFGQYMDTLPIPDASTNDREEVARLARRAQDLHTRRRTLVERLFQSTGIRLADSTSHNSFERPWTMTVNELSKKCSRLKADEKLALKLREETGDLTQEIRILEGENDEKVASLYGVAPEPTFSSVSDEE